MSTEETNRKNRIARARNFSVSHDSNVMEAIKKMEIVQRKLLLVFEQNRYLGLLSIGDIQRSLLRTFDLSVKIKDVMRVNQKFAREGDSTHQIRSRILELRAEMMPVLDSSNDLYDIFLWEDFFPDVTRVSVSNVLATPVVIMAGGQGTRLRPITNVIPKALVPIGERPLIDEIIHRFNSLGVRHFYVSLNYKGDLIQHYFSSMANKGYEISYLHEHAPLGTVGALKQLQDKLKATFFVSNCDILIEQDYSEIYRYHAENANQLTVVGVLKTIKIPYGTIEVGDGGMLKSMREKPEMNFVINSGMYLMEPSVLDLIPNSTPFDAPALIAEAQKKGMKVGVFPVSDGSWKDIGDWSNYIESVASTRLKVQ